MTKAVLIRISTQEIIKKALYPSKDIVPIESLDKDKNDPNKVVDLKWLIVNELPRPIAGVDYDPFTEKFTIPTDSNPESGITTDAHPVYTELDQYRISYTITALTQQEQDDFQQSADDSDASATQQQQYKNDGVVGFDRAYALIIRKVNDTITPNQGKLLAQLLYPHLEPLYKGLWQLVKANLNNASTGSLNVAQLAIFNKIKTGVDNYVTNNY